MSMSSRSIQFPNRDLCILSSLADLVCGPFFIPIINVFTLRLPCMVSGSVCYSSANAVLAVIGLVAGLLYIVLCLLLSATYFTRYDSFSGFIAWLHIGPPRTTTPLYFNLADPSR
jgi:hypothetical protein